MLRTIARERLEKLRSKTRGIDSVFAEYTDRPVEFIREVIGEELEVELPDGSWSRYQADICRALIDNDRVTVRSGQKTGKSYIAIRLAVWWACTRPNGRVTLTSSSDAQVKDPLWREIQELHRRLGQRSVEIFPAPALDPATGVRWEDGRSIKGFATDKPVNAAGKSGAEQLFILDEASGIKNEIAEAFIGNTMGGGKILAISNPTETSGWFFDTFHSRREHWDPHQLSARETPNYRAGKVIVPGLATRERVAELVDAYGEDSPFVQVRVNGDFPTESSNVVIGLGLVESARKRWSEADHSGKALDIGVDVALFGDDDSAIVGRRGLTLYSPKWIKAQHNVEAVVHGYDAAKVAGQILIVTRALRRPDEPVKIKIDAGGGYGSAVASHLRQIELDKLIEIVEVNVATSSCEPENYPQLRDELWFGMREWLKAGGAFSPDERLEVELQAPKYAPTRKGQFKVDDKATIKKAIKRSPDIADAACLAVYDAKPALITNAYSRSRKLRGELPQARE